jgi:hypothetical protein
MDNLYNQNLQLMVGCKLRNEEDDKSMSVIDIDCFIPKVSFQFKLSFGSKGCYPKEFKHFFSAF